ncbi:MAG: translocation protein S66 [Cirrosporium novae-zelandiae]|nr:MAG: translocation protein S66 [Cirrosporium novae-zelandiae]
MPDWLSLTLPLAYLTVLIGSLATFSYLYRRRKAVQSAHLEPWFGPHLQRDIYLSLVHFDQDPEPGEKKAPQVPETILKAALLRRAIEDVHRIFRLRTSKQALSSLLQRGSVGDDLWKRFLRAEKEMELEVRDVVQEAEGLQQGWGQVIFQSAGEMLNNEMFRKKLNAVTAQVDTEKKWWEKRRAAIQADFMKELDEETIANKVNVVGEKQGSDEDAVLVDAGGPAVPTKGGAKKKKGKK